MECDIRLEELARFSAGEVPAEHVSEIEQHLRLCERCRTRLGSLDEVGTILGVLPRSRLPARALLCIRRALSAEVRGLPSEIMTLEEVAEFLRLRQDDLEWIAEALPAFEVAGQVRVRRTRLIEWIEKRERSYMKAAVESDIARAVSGTSLRGALR